MAPKFQSLFFSIQQDSQSNSTTTTATTTSNRGEVLISTSWDLDRQTEGFVPLYMLWNLPSKYLIIYVEILKTL